MLTSELAIDVGAALRLTRLVMADTFPPVERSRQWIRQEGPEWALELIECPWCVGMWAALGVATAREVAPRLWNPLAKALAASLVVGVVGEKTGLLRDSG